MEGSVRVTPYDVVFGADAFDESRFELLREQAATHGAASPTELFMLPAAGELLRELLPDGAADTHRERVAQVSALMFHGFRFWLHGKTIVRIAETELRALLTDTGSAGEWAFRTPAAAGYVQLALNVLWARVGDDAPAEPVDGFFWSASGMEENPARLDLLLCLGVRRGRPGVSVVDLTVEAGEALAQWADADARPGAADFANVLPGGELKDYHSIVTQAEVLKLAARCFRHIERRRSR